MTDKQIKAHFAKLRRKVKVRVHRAGSLKRRDRTWPYKRRPGRVADPVNHARAAGRFRCRYLKVPDPFTVLAQAERALDRADATLRRAVMKRLDQEHAVLQVISGGFRSRDFVGLHKASMQRHAAHYDWANAHRDRASAAGAVTRARKVVATWRAKRKLPC